MIVDAHHHLWDPGARAYPWMSDAIAPVVRKFDIGDLAAALPKDVAHTIVVQAVGTLEETQALLRIANESERIAGVVGWIDLSANADEQLGQLLDAPGGSKLVGIRHQVQDESDPQWLLRDDVLAGIVAVGARGLVYDLLVRQRELAAAAQAVAALPQVSFVLDHGAKPQIAHGTMEPWRAGIARLAELPNVTCKLSGLVTEADWTRGTDREILPYAKVLLDTFGATRVMFGSDWPVCLLAGDYQRVLQLARAACSRLSADETNAVFAGNAIRVYALQGIA